MGCPSQILVEIAPDLHILPEHMGTSGAEIFDKKLRGGETEDFTPLAGYSGGPVVMHVEGSNHLVGLVSECSQNQGRIMVVPWDVAYEALDRQVLSPSRLNLGGSS